MLRQLFSGVLGVFALVLTLTASPALADRDDRRDADDTRHHAPEFDIAAAGAVAAVVAGGGILLARRRRNRAQ